MDINEDPTTPAHLRWDLRQDVSHHSSLTAGKILRHLEEHVLYTVPETADKAFLPPDLLETEDASDSPPGYLTLDHEEEYLSRLDASLSQTPPTDNLPPDIEAVQLASVPRPRLLPTEKDFFLQSPVSVYNWLKRNRPQTFDHAKERVDSERSDENGNKKVSSGKGRKDKHASKQDPEFEGADDDIGFDAVLDVPASGKGKKKLDDHAYRPKGGSSKPTKRKRDKEDGGEGKAGKKVKKSSNVVVEEAQSPHT